MKKIENLTFHDILKEVFPSSDIPNFVLDLKIGDIIEWDSIGNFNLLLYLEEFYNIKFSFDEIVHLNSVSTIILSIESKK